jgi:hypothetical protein
MHSVVFLGLVFIIFGGAGNSVGAKNAEKGEKLSRYLPKKINGWSAQSKDELYDSETIFEYIDGAGEVYRAYNFQSLLARRYLKDKQPGLTADFFDMATSADAFGVFTHDLEGDSLEIGHGAVYKSGLLSFWKDRYFVNLSAEEETQETRAALLALGQMIASTIPEEGTLPDILSCIPQSLESKTVRYFHSALILNYHFFISTDNILLLNQKTEAVLASSGEKPDKTFLLIVRYPEARTAADAWRTFNKAYMPNPFEPGLIQTEDKKWTAVKKRGNYLIVFFEAPSAATAKNIAAEAAEKTRD